jgi:acyl-CoA synthetase (AMP-forming)/AMP-acid ligase II
MELGLLLEMAASDDPDRMAITEAGGRSLTRGQLQAASAAVAAGLQRDGATALAYLATNHSAFAIALFGAAAAGIPFVPLNYRLSDDQLAELLARHDGLTVVTDTPKRATALGPSAVVERDEFVRGALEAGAIDAPAPPDDNAIAVLLYTSGTTSAPKAAVLRHRHLTSYVIGSVDFGSAGPDDAVLVSVPPYHIAGVSNLLSSIYSGRRLVYLDPFDPQRWLELVAAERITHAMVVPTMLARIVDALGAATAPPLPSLAYGGSRMPITVLERALRAFPDTAFANAYGLTETSSTITVLGPDDHRQAMASDDPAVRARLESVGRALPGVEIEIRDGDVWVRGEQVSGEYVGSASAVDADGWFETRDRGRLDDGGYLFIEGRSDDTIIRGGENVAPAEVEDALLRHPAVAESAVVGIPDEEWGQRIAAVVVLRPGASVDLDELREWSRSLLRSAKTPDVIEVRDALPYTDTGKLLRRVVRDSFVPTADGAATPGSTGS